ncbi:TOM1-like protein 1 [Impatiens glandulifera]|uniref:TOM1-like protein 1 n=1 Tax=Impatiens glandulifera TaxID=253017 RepID=UPI001FB0C7FD|nr:TOM1-like protein 1 [Impatiens glandulifera]XP_047319588.1 TOM1-like protein 1 [Impatiens glandulifera]
MSDNLLEKVSSFSEKLMIGGAEVSRKMTAGMSSMSDKVKELFQGPNQTDKLVEEATAETLDEPDWATNLELCDMVNLDKINSVELIRGLKKRIMLKNPRVQFLALVLLETVVKNCEKAFSEVAAERVLDEMVKLIDDPQTVINSRNKALILIEAWGESTDELRYLPVFEETYKSLKSRGIRFPGRDNESLAPIFTPTPSIITSSETSDNLAQHISRDILPPVTFSVEQVQEELEVARNSAELLATVLSSSPGEDASEDEATLALVQQCHRSQFTVQRMIETAGENEALMFEALNVNDELQKILSKYEDLKKPDIVRQGLEPAMIPVAVEPEDSLQWKEDDTTLVRKPSGSRAAGVNNNNDEMMDDLDEMIFGKKAGNNSEGADDAKKNDLISF